MRTFAQCDVSLVCKAGQPIIVYGLPPGVVGQTVGVSSYVGATSGLTLQGITVPLPGLYGTTVGIDVDGTDEEVPPLVGRTDT